MPISSDGPDIVYEFFAPFAHVEGRYEWCRIHSPTHGVFDTFILVGERPVVVYVNDAAGQRFMADRYPESTCHRVPKAALSIRASKDGRTVTGLLRASSGPVGRASMTLAASKGAKPVNVPYGGEGQPVWGSGRWTCWGVDLVLKGRAKGRVEWRGRRADNFDATPALITMGSFGRISPLVTKKR